MFETQLAAGKALTNIVKEALNQFAGPDNDDGSIFFDGLASDFGKVDKKLTTLVQKHWLGFSDECLALIANAKHEARIGITSYGLDYQEQTQPDYNLSGQTIKHVEALCRLLNEAVEQMREDLCDDKLDLLKSNPLPAK